METLQSNLSSTLQVSKEKEKRMELQEIELQEQLHWMQKSHILWNINGEWNTGSIMQGPRCGGCVIIHMVSLIIEVSGMKTGSDL